MSGKLKNFRRVKRAINAPFAPEILARAKVIADRYQIIVWFEDGEYFGRGLETPTSFGDGKTPDDCVRNTREGLILTVASILADGEVPPSPASEGKRSVQVNVRLSAEEKLILETAAKRKGFEGLSDYIRAVAIAGAGN